MSKPKLSKKRWLVLAVILTIGLLILFFAKLFFGPAEGTITEPTTNNTSDQSASVDYTRYNGSTASFAYRQKDRLEPSKDLPPSIIESYLISAKGSNKQPGWRLAVTVYYLQAGVLEENSSYKIRQDNPSMYKRSESTIGNHNLIIFENTDGAEKVAFFKDGGRLAAVGLTSSVLTDESNHEFNHLIESWRWL